MARILRRVWPALLLALGLAAILALDPGRFLSPAGLLEAREALGAVVAERPVIAALSFVLLYAVAVACLFPAATLLTIVAGLVFGGLLGGVLAVVGAGIGACVLFLAARHLFGDALRRRAGGWVARVSQGFNRDAFSYLLVLRLTPLVPFFALNVAPAFLGVPFRTFAAATFLGILPGAFVYAFVGSGLDGALLAAAEGSAGLADLVTPEARLALLGLAALAVLGLLLKRFVLGRGAGAAVPTEAGDAR